MTATPHALQPHARTSAWFPPCDMVSSPMDLPTFSPPRIAEIMDADLGPQDFIVPTLGPATFRSPLGLSTVHGDGLGDFVHDGARVRYHIESEPGQPPHPDLIIEKAGPREMIFFEPGRCKAAIVTCGGLCPGLNNVAIRNRSRLSCFLMPSN